MIDKNELVNIKKTHPYLELKENKGKQCLVGKLAFSAVYKQEIDQLIIYPGISSKNEVGFIEDEYSLKIELLDSFPYSFPVVWETGGRISSIMKKHNIKEEVNAACQ